MHMILRGRGEVKELTITRGKGNGDQERQTAEGDGWVTKE